MTNLRSLLDALLMFAPYLTRGGYVVMKQDAGDKDVVNVSLV